MKKIIFVLSFIFCVINLGAQTIDDVSLVVSGDGPTKESATHVALRSAIEQAYGVFVSANTEILNDELVKDEIATVTSGNVKSYEELSSVVLPNGNHLVSLKAVVSTKKLTAYAQSKGASCEFAGAIFGANLKLYELNKKNTEIAFENLIKQAKALAPYLYTPTLQMGTPQKSYDNIFEVPFTISLYSTPSTNEFINLIYSTLEALKINDEQLAMLKEMNMYYESIYIDLRVLSKSDGSLVWRGESDCWGCEIKYESWYFYAKFPSSKLFSDVYNFLPKYYCILDNFNNKYYDDSNKELNYKLLNKLCHSINQEIIYSEGPIYISSSKIGLPKHEVDKFANQSLLGALFGISNKKKKKKTKKESTFNPIYLQSYNGKITIEEEKLVKISNFELKKLTEEQNYVYNFIEDYHMGTYNVGSIPHLANYMLSKNLDYYNDFYNEILQNKVYIDPDKLLLAEIHYNKQNYKDALQLYRSTYGIWGSNKDIKEHYLNSIKYAFTNNDIKDDYDLKVLYEMANIRDSHSIELIKQYFDCLDSALKNDIDFEFKYVHFEYMRDDKITLDLLKNIENSINKGASYTSYYHLLKLYKALKEREPQNKIWHTKYHEAYKKWLKN